MSFRKTMAQGKLEQARKYILAHPFESKSQCVLATGLSEATIARARRDLIAEGLLAESRKVDPRAGVKLAPPQPKPPPEPKPEPEEKRPVGRPKKDDGTKMLDHAAMLEIAAMADKFVEVGDDEAIQKVLLKQALTFAMRTDLHPDTRMSASQQWMKLRDMAKQKDLGPGKPKTRVDAIRRAADMLLAIGPEMTVEAVNLAFTVKEADIVPDEQAVAPSGPSQDAGAAGHESGPTPAQDLR